MCIGVPMKIDRTEGMIAVAETAGADGTVERHTLDMLIDGPQPPGTWVLAFCGAARRVLDEAEARQILDANGLHCISTMSCNAGEPCLLAARQLVDDGVLEAGMNAERGGRGPGTGAATARR